MSVTGNCYRMTPDGSLDREYLRITAIYRLMKNGHVTAAQAKDLAHRPIRGHHKPNGWLDSTIEIWARAIERWAA